MNEEEKGVALEPRPEALKIFLIPFCKHLSLAAVRSCRSETLHPNPEAVEPDLELKRREC